MQIIFISDWIFSANFLMIEKNEATQKQQKHKQTKRFHWVAVQNICLKSHIDAIPICHYISIKALSLSQNW